ncbi:hypothetical protein J6590_014052 [Homalodisca vitripennis]|nr:hypothetical protein J6590_014052 [Homalodisca vitripennis]
MDQANKIQIGNRIKRLYAIGDNLNTDIFGANLYNECLSSGKTKVTADASFRIEEENCSVCNCYSVLVKPQFIFLLVQSLESNAVTDLTRESGVVFVCPKSIRPPTSRRLWRNRPARTGYSRGGASLLLPILGIEYDPVTQAIQIKEWFRRFKNGRTSVESDDRSGRFFGQTQHQPTTTASLQFDDVEQIKQNATKDLLVIPQNEFKECFRKWEERWNKVVVEGITLKETTLPLPPSNTGVYSHELSNSELDHSPRDFLNFGHHYRQPSYTVQDVSEAIDMIFQLEAYK